MQIQRYNNNKKRIFFSKFNFFRICLQEGFQNSNYFRSYRYYNGDICTREALNAMSKPFFPKDTIFQVLPYCTDLSAITFRSPDRWVYASGMDPTKKCQLGTIPWNYLRNVFCHYNNTNLHTMWKDIHLSNEGEAEMFTRTYRFVFLKRQKSNALHKLPFGHCREWRFVEPEWERDSVFQFWFVRPKLC